MIQLKVVQFCLGGNAPISTFSGRASGTIVAMEDTEDSLRNKKVHLTKEDLIEKIDELRENLFSAHEKISELTEKVIKQGEELRDKEKRLRSYAARNTVLEGRLREYEEGEVAVPGHPPIKEWESLGQDRKRKVTQKVVDEVTKTAQERRMEPEKLVGAILKRYVVVPARNA